MIHRVAQFLSLKKLRRLITGKGAVFKSPENNARVEKSEEPDKLLCCIISCHELSGSRVGMEYCTGVMFISAADRNALDS